MKNPAAGIHCALITPLKNERDNVESLWTSIRTQTHTPDEWIITDNGSIDGTYEWLIAHATDSPFPIKVLSLPG
ncbi:MAG: glycosyltransferase [Chitinispirillaceae bacterium]|jgi:glycosyltransferase involved in cell wall biosynthesis